MTASCVTVLNGLETVCAPLCPHRVTLVGLRLVSARLFRPNSLREPGFHMVDISTVSTIIVTVSVVIGVLFTLMELRHLTKTRRTDVIMRIYDRFGSKEIVEAMFSVGQLRPGASPSFPPKGGLTGVTQIAIVFEGLGVLLEQELIDIKLVDSLFGPTLDALWEPIRPLIYWMRESLKQPSFFSHFEYLHSRLNDYRKGNA